MRESGARKGEYMGFRSGIVVWLLCLLSMLSTAHAASSDKPFHLDPANLPAGCATCHMGSNFNNGGGVRFCISCHGPDARKLRSSLKKDRQLKDVGSEFAKNYRHPAFTKTGIHRSREILPEINAAAPRHAECGDCHHPHFISSENRLAGIKGKKVGNFTTEITKQTELCYLCHGESANLPLKATNKKVEFTITNASFHPVEGEGKNQSVLSLLRPYREKKLGIGDISVITCGDCHGSDDPNAPRGPHGSKYEGLLVENYLLTDGNRESNEAYALCYRCHRRTSIMGNESFPKHSWHIAGGVYKAKRTIKGKDNVDIVTNVDQVNGGTSCYTCHNSHGSVENRYLIRFNRDLVTESSSGKLKFVEKGINTFHGECWLTCHGVDHNPKTY